MAIYATSKIQPCYNIGNSGFAAGVNSTATGMWSNLIKTISPTPFKIKLSQFSQKVIDDTRNAFIEKNIELIDNNNFDSLYERALIKFGENCEDDLKIIIPELRKMFKECDIDDLKYMDFLPDYYLYGDQHISKFEIPANIRQISSKDLVVVPNLNHIIWKTKFHDSNSFPSFYDIYHATKAPSSQFKNLTIEFPERNYDKKWIKQLKEFLKERSKLKREDLKPLRIKFIDKKKDIKIF